MTLTRTFICLIALTALSACATGSEILQTVIAVSNPSNQPYTIISR